MHKLMIKCRKLFSKKKFYKQEFLKMSKEFDNLKEIFSKVVLSNEQLENDLKNSISIKNELNRSKLENGKFSKEIYVLKSSISKFKKGKETLDSIDRKSTRLNSSHSGESRMPSSA